MDNWADIFTDSQLVWSFHLVLTLTDAHSTEEKQLAEIKQDIIVD